MRFTHAMRPRLIISFIQDNLLLAGIYALLGIAGLQLAIPPGYASAVFPAAGISFAAILYGGNRLLPGAWLGSAIINLWVAWRHDNLDATSLLVALIIALGAAFQAWVAVFLVRYHLKDNWRILDNDSDILRFLMLAGPLACLISASWANCTLALFKFMSVTEWAFNWWNWWIGDTIGVLLFAPLALMVLQRRNALWRTRLVQVAMPTLAVTAGIIAGFTYVSHGEAFKFKQNIDEHALFLANQLQDKLLSYEEIVASLSNFIRVSPNPIASDFAGFTRQSFVDHPDLQALSWNPFLARNARKPFEAVMSQEQDMPGFHITQHNPQNQLVAADNRDHYIAVRYITPLDRNRRALGYDIASDPVRRSAIDAAIRSGKPTITAPIRLVQETGSSLGVLLLDPIYQDQLTNGNHAASEPRQLHGFAVGVFRVEEMFFRDLAQNLPDTLAFLLEDPDAPEGSKRLYLSGPAMLPQLTRFAWNGDIPVAGRTWRLSVYPTQAYFAANRSFLAWLVLAAGLILASLLQAFLLAITGRAAIIQRQVNEQTQKLSLKEKFLRLSQEGGGIGTWEADLVNDRQTWSDNCLALLGFPPQAKRMHKDFLELVHPDDRQRVSDAIQSHIHGGNPYDVEYRAITAHGHIRWLRSAGQVECDAKGKPIILRGIVQDITERHNNQKQIEQLLDEQKAILENRLVGIVTVRDRRIVWANPAFGTITGYAAHELVGMTTRQFYAQEDDYQTVGTAYANIGDQGIVRSQLEFMHKDGRHVWVDMSGTALHQESGETLWICIDVTERKNIETALRQKEGYQRALLDSFPFMVWLKDTHSRFLAVNRLTAQILGENDPDNLVGKTDFDYSPKALAEAYQSDDRAVLASNQRKMVEEEHVDHLGESSWIETFKAPVVDGNGDILGTVGFARDISDRKKSEMDLRIAATVFESQEGMLVTDANNCILRANRAFTEITGYSAEEVIGKNPRLLQSGRQDANFYASMWAGIRDKGSWDGEIWNRRKNGEIYPQYLTITAVKDRDGHVTHHVATLSDITSNKAAVDQIKHLAFYDPLTGLPNRQLLRDRLKPALTKSHRNNHRGALLFIDMDNFKTLNDTLGHDMGDMLLQQVAARLTACVREHDTVARLGGDEFVIMLEDLSDQVIEAAAQTEIIGNKILAALNQPYLLGIHDYHSTSSIGAALFNGRKQAVEELLKQADIAMYQAKTAGRNALRFFDPRMQANITARAALEADLHRALTENQFRLYYQPQVYHHQIIGAEALIRWCHPRRGLVSPAEFIPLSEETGLIVPIGQWVLETACAQIKQWENNAHTRHLQLAVNVSAYQFRQPGFVEHVLQVMRQSAIKPGRLKLELTESLVLDDIDGTILKMKALGEIGVRFSMDDFGTGYSSLSSLKKLPIDQLKIDQSFVRDIGSDPDDAVIVQTIIAMATHLGMEVIAEGVETEAQRIFLKNHGCLLCQGYLFSKPVPIDQFEALLKQG